MPQKRDASQPHLHDVSQNGIGQDHRATAETVAPEQDIQDVLGPEKVPYKSKLVDFDLDGALGDEDALKSDGTVDIQQPPEVRSPRKREFLRVHPGFSRTATVVEYAPAGSTGRSYYLATKEMKLQFEEEDLKVVRLVLCQSLTTKAWFIWPMNVNPDGRDNAWNTSSERFAEEAKVKWVRRVNRKTGYGIKYAPEGQPDPEWPDKSWTEIILEAFRDRIIDSVTHAVYIGIETGA